MSNASKEMIGLVVPGVGHDLAIARNILRLRRHPAFAIVEIFGPEWKEGETDFAPKVDRLVDTMGKLRKAHKGTPIVVFEISAGGTLGEIATHQRQNWVAAKALICARVRSGHTTLPSQEAVLKAYPIHVHAVTVFERDIEPHLSSDERARRITMTPEFDEIVPVESMQLPGAHSFTMPETRAHAQGISAAISTHLQVIIDFAQKHL